MPAPPMCRNEPATGDGTEHELRRALHNDEVHYLVDDSVHGRVHGPRDRPIVLGLHQGPIFGLGGVHSKSNSSTLLRVKRCKEAQWNENSTGFQDNHCFPLTS